MHKSIIFRKHEFLAHFKDSNSVSTCISYSEQTNKSVNILSFSEKCRVLIAVQGNVMAVTWVVLSLVTRITKNQFFMRGKNHCKIHLKFLFIVKGDNHFWTL